MLQAEDRVHRIGQNSSSVHYHYLSGGEGTLDPILFQYLQRKYQTVVNVLNGASNCEVELIPKPSHKIHPIQSFTTPKESQFDPSSSSVIEKKPNISQIKPNISQTKPNISQIKPNVDLNNSLFPQLLSDFQNSPSSHTKPFSSISVIERKPNTSQIKHFGIQSPVSSDVGLNKSVFPLLSDFQHSDLNMQLYIESTFKQPEPKPSSFREIEPPGMVKLPSIKRKPSLPIELPLYENIMNEIREEKEKKVKLTKEKPDLIIIPQFEAFKLKKMELTAGLSSIQRRQFEGCVQPTLEQFKILKKPKI